MGLWWVHHDELDRVEALAASMKEAAQGDSVALTHRMGRSLSAFLAAKRGNTDLAISTLRGLSPVGRREDLVYDTYKSLAPERILLAESLILTGEAEEAYAVAALLDHSGPMIYPAFLARSLAIRLQAAEELRWHDVASRARARLVALGWYHPEDLFVPIH